MDVAFEFNSSHYFELLDRTHVASSYVQMAIGDHPVLAKHPELNAIYEQVAIAHHFRTVAGTG